MLKSTSLFVATTMIATIVAVGLSLRLRSDNQEMARLRERVAQLELAQLRQPVAVGQPAAGRIAEKSATSAEAQADAIAVPKADRPVAMRTLSTQERLRNEPAFRELALAQLRTQARARHPDLGKALGLTFEQLDALFDLIATDQVNTSVRTQEFYASAEGKKAPTLRQAIEAQLGPAKYQQYQEYQQTQGSRIQVEELRATLYGTAYPLSEEQKESLLGKMVIEQKRRGEELRALRLSLSGTGSALDLTEATLKSTELVNQRILQEAQNILGPQQVAALRSSMDQLAALNRANLNAQRAHQGGAN